MVGVRRKGNPITMDRVRQFFDEFVADFCSFDGKIIATRYIAPYTAIDSDGKVRLFDRVDDIAVLFQGYLDAYYKQGIKTCSYRDFEVIAIGGKCVCATVTWDMLDQSGQVIESWRESYNIIDSVNTLKVFTSIDH